MHVMILAGGLLLFLFHVAGRVTIVIIARPLCFFSVLDEPRITKKTFLPSVCIGWLPIYENKFDSGEFFFWLAFLSPSLTVITIF